MAEKSLADITAQAQALLAEIQAKGVNVTDTKSIVSSAKALLGLIEQVQPHVNKANTAFGGQDANVAAINDLRNKLNKIIATYST